MDQWAHKCEKHYSRIWSHEHPCTTVAQKSRQEILATESRFNGLRNMRGTPSAMYKVHLPLNQTALYVVIVNLWQQSRLLVYIFEHK